MIQILIDSLWHWFNSIVNFALRIRRSLRSKDRRWWSWQQIYIRMFGALQSNCLNMISGIILFEIWVLKDPNVRQEMEFHDFLDTSIIKDDIEM